MGGQINPGFQVGGGAGPSGLNFSGNAGIY